MPPSTEEPFELIQRFTDPATAVTGYIVIHSKRRGPAFGGCRFASYASEDDALRDAKRLAEAMSIKNALAELPFGGGKAVLMQPPYAIPDRSELFRAFGRAVARLDGAYITAEDVGTTPQDMLVVRDSTRYVSGIPRDEGFGGDPARFTAWGVFLAIKTAARLILERDTLSDLKVAVQGGGSVGTQLCKLLHRAGARLWISDIDPAKARRVHDHFGAEILSNAKLLSLPVDILAPCALGGVIDSDTVERVGARIVAGAANNQLTSLEVGDELHARGIWYLPDFLINAGGIIAVAHEYLGTLDESAVCSEISRIGARTAHLIQTVRNDGSAPATIALRWARDLLAHAPG